MVEEIKREPKEYASKGLAGTALGFGIGGAALGLWNAFGRGRGHGFGGVGMPENININANGLGGGARANGPTAYEVEQKECADVLALQKGLYEQALNTQINRFNDRQVIDGELFGLYKSQTDADFSLYKNQRDGFDILSNRISGLEKDVAIGAAIRPYQDQLIKCEIDRAFTAGINYTNEKTCKAIYGELVLPNTPVVTGYGSYSPCRCSATPAAPAAAVLSK